MSDDILHHVPALRAYSRALCRNLTDAEDLVQDTLLRGIEKAHRYQPGTNMRAWLFTIMRNRFLTNCHKSRREPTGAADCASLQPVTQPDQEWHVQMSEMQHALRDMPQHYREAIILVGVIGESYLDTAHLLKCDIGTVKSRVNRARGMLRDVLEPAF